MLTSRRDYLLRVIDEAARLLARVVLLRTQRRELDALESVVAGCERLFALPAPSLFQLSPEQQFLHLTLGVDDPVSARDRVLLYAALNAEAAEIYTTLGNVALAQASWANALRFTLRARELTGAAEAPPPPYAPAVSALRARLPAQALDPELTDLLGRHDAAARTDPPGAH